MCNWRVSRGFVREIFLLFFFYVASEQLNKTILYLFRYNLISNQHIILVFNRKHCDYQEIFYSQVVCVMSNYLVNKSINVSKMRGFSDTKLSFPSK